MNEITPVVHEKLSAWIFEAQDHLPSHTSSKCLLQLCKVSSVHVHTFKEKLCLQEIWTDKMDGQGDSYTPYHTLSLGRV